MDRQTVALMITASVSFVALVAAIGASRRLTSIRKSLKVLEGTFEGQTLIDAVATYARDLRALDQDIRALGSRQDELFARLARSARRVGVVRYDAFEDMGGRMSFSAAILNDHGDGVVMTSINGRTEARTYAKVVEQGESDHNLSPEEQSAISEALGGGVRARRS